MNNTYLIGLKMDIYGPGYEIRRKTVKHWIKQRNRSSTHFWLTPDNYHLIKTNDRWYDYGSVKSSIRKIRDSEKGRYVTGQIIDNYQYVFNKWAVHFHVSFPTLTSVLDSSYDGHNPFESEIGESGMVTSVTENILDILDEFQHVFEKINSSDNFAAIQTLLAFEYREYESGGGYWDPPEWDVDITFLGTVDSFHIRKYRDDFGKESALNALRTYQSVLFNNSNLEESDNIHHIKKASYYAPLATPYQSPIVFEKDFDKLYKQGKDLYEKGYRYWWSYYNLWKESDWLPPEKEILVRNTRPISGCEDIIEYVFKE